MKVKVFLLSLIVSLTLMLTACKGESVDKVTVVFDSTGGSEVASVQVNKGDKVTKPTDPTKESYTFDAWTLDNRTYSFDTLVTEDITLKATWKTAGNTECTVTFDSDGGTFVSSVKVNSGDTLPTITNPTRSGYTFVGWTLDGENFDVNTTITQSIVLTAKWEKANGEALQIFTVTFDSNGGSAIDAIEVEEDSYAKEPDYPTRDGYIFDGWELNNNFFDFYKNKITGNITLVALWTKQTAEGQIPMTRFGTNTMIYSALNDLHITGIGGPNGQLEALYDIFEVTNTTDLSERVLIRFSLYLASENDPENSLVSFDVALPSGVSTEVTSMPVGVANSVVVEYLTLASMKNPNVVNTVDYKYAIQYVDTTEALITSNHSNFSTTTKFDFTPVTAVDGTIPMGGFTTSQLVFENNGGITISNLNAHSTYLKYFFDVETTADLNEKMDIVVSFYFKDETDLNNSLFTKNYSMPNGNELLINSLQLVMMFEEAAELNDAITSDEEYKVNVRFVSKDSSIKSSEYSDFSNNASIQFGEDDSVVVPEGDLVLSVRNTDMYNGNHAKMFLSVNLMTAENHSNFSIMVESNEFGGLTISENEFYVDHIMLTLFLNASYEDGKTYTFKVIVKIGSKVESIDVTITAPGGNTGGGGNETLPEVPEGELAVTLNSVEIYGDKFIKLHLNNSLSTGDNFNDFQYDVECEQVNGYISIGEKWNGGFRMDLPTNYGPGVEYTFVVTITIGDKSVTETFVVTSPGTPIDPNADIQLPDILGYILHGVTNDYVVDFDWRTFNSTVNELTGNNTVGASQSIVFKYVLFDTDAQVEIGTVIRAFGGDYTTILLQKAETVALLEQYLSDNSLETVNLTISLVVQASENPTLSQAILASNTVVTENIVYNKAKILTGSFMYNEYLLEGNVGESNVQVGQVSTWVKDSSSQETTLDGDTINIVGNQNVDGIFWEIQLFAKFNAVTEAGTYKETLSITSDVAGTITINRQHYELIVGTTDIVLMFDLQSGQNSSLSIQFGKEGAQTIGNFNISIEGITKSAE